MSYRYDGNGGFTQEKPTPPKKDDDNDIGSWLLIAIMFVTIWPVGLFMLIKKLSQDDKKGAHASSAAKKETVKVKSKAAAVTKTPDDSKTAARVLYIVGAALSAVGAIVGISVLGDLGFYIEYGDWMWFLEELFVCLGFLSSGVSLLLFGRSMKRRMRRFAKYLAAAGKRPSVSISRLASAAEVSERRVERDLDIMIERGMWGAEAYVDLGAGKLFRSAEAAEEQEQPVAVPTEAEQGYSGVLRQIRRANDRIADETLSRQIDRLEEIAGRIFRLIEEEPEKKAKASTFLNYYLPTTQKLLDSYAEFEEAGVSGGNLSQAKRKIEQTMENIVAGFERQLDELYRADAMDIDSDIRVMETMLRRDGAYVEDDFGLGGVAVQTQEK